MSKHMPIICPTITATTNEEYTKQLTQAISLSNRVHLDYSDGTIAPRKLLALSEMDWPASGVAVDIHVMSTKPNIESLISLRQTPNLVIVHAEAELDVLLVANQLHQANIKLGLALLETSPVKLIQSYLSVIDHVLIFSGHLGYQGGSRANLDLIEKVHWLKLQQPSLEVGWDGGINDNNIVKIISGGVEVANVGGFIQYSADPKVAYAKLKSLLI